MVRIVVDAAEMVEMSLMSKGRGAWLCANSPRCIDLALKRRAFERAFKRELDESSLQALRAESARQAEAAEGVGG
jgi:predicted RNA-binding protein YlxR (DUF448 family)